MLYHPAIIWVNDLVILYDCKYDRDTLIPGASKVMFGKSGRPCGGNDANDIDNNCCR